MIDQIAVSVLLAALPLAVLAMGTWLMMRVMAAFDLTVDAAYTAGAALFAVATIRTGSPWLGLAAAAAGGILIELVSVMLHRLLGIDILLSSLIVATGMYSINLGILHGSDINLIGVPTVLGSGVDTQSAIVLAVFDGIGALALLLFLQTRLGLGLRAAGANPKMARAVGINARRMLTLAAVISGVLVGVGGALQAQVQGFADVNMGAGTVIVAVSVMLLGEMLVAGRRGVAIELASVTVGAIIYQVVIAGALRSGLPAQDLKLITSTLLIAVIGLTAGRARIKAAWQGWRRSRPRALSGLSRTVLPGVAE